MYTIWHDCGEPGRTYYTEYSEIDIKKEGGIEAIKRRYEMAGINIKWIQYIPEKPKGWLTKKRSQRFGNAIVYAILFFLTGILFHAVFIGR